MKPSPPEAVRELYEATADSYAGMMDTEIQLPVYAEVLATLHKLIADLPGLVIDSACGPGHMLAMYRDHYDRERALVGVDLSPCMVALARRRLGSGARLQVGDMRTLEDIESCSAAALLNWFAVHHLSAASVREAMHEWYRVLAPGGQLLLAAWEGAGPIDYGEASDIVAIRYTAGKLSALAGEVGFEVVSCAVKPVDEFPMDAVYLECVRP
jgi:ubiquinone/menaquinone biosynthesis C-methylase UbiE